MLQRAMVLVGLVWRMSNAGRETFKYNKYYMFYMVQVTIRDIDPAVFREFKADAVKRGMKIGSALTLAMEKFRADLGRKKARFSALQPTHWGSEKISEEIDAILYEK